MPSIFERIISGEIPAYKILEDDNFLAFLDAFPLVEGHTLVIPKQTIDYIFDLEQSQYAGLHLFSQKIAQAIHKAIPCRKVGMAVVGLEVPHAHIHLIPIHHVSDMDFSRPKLKLSAEVMEETAAKIRSFL